MKTAKGNTYQVLLDMTVVDNTLTVNIPVKNSQLGDITAEMIVKAIPFISERIQSEKRGSGVLERELLRIEIHREQLKNAYLNLWQFYVTATTPQTRTGSTAKTRMDMFALMNDKILRSFASGILPDDQADNFVLPDERQKLIDVLIVQMNGK